MVNFGDELLPCEDPGSHYVVIVSTIVIVKTQFESKIVILSKLCQCPKRGNDQKVFFLLVITIMTFLIWNKLF